MATAKSRSYFALLFTQMVTQPIMSRSRDRIQGELHLVSPRSGAKTVCGPAHHGTIGTSSASCHQKSVLRTRLDTSPFARQKASSRPFVPSHRLAMLPAQASRVVHHRARHRVYHYDHHITRQHIIARISTSRGISQSTSQSTSQSIRSHHTSLIATTHCHSRRLPRRPITPSLSASTVPSMRPKRGPSHLRLRPSIKPAAHPSDTHASICLSSTRRLHHAAQITRIHKGTNTAVLQLPSQMYRYSQPPVPERVPKMQRCKLHRFPPR